MRALKKVGIYGGGVSAYLLALVLLKHRIDLHLYEPSLFWDFARPFPHPEDPSFKAILKDLPLFLRKVLKFRVYPGAYYNPLEQRLLYDPRASTAVHWTPQGLYETSPLMLYRYSEPEEGYLPLLQQLKEAILTFGERLHTWDEEVRITRRLGIFSRLTGLAEEISFWIVLLPERPGIWEIPGSLPSYVPLLGIGETFSYWLSSDGNFFYQEGAPKTQTLSLLIPTTGSRILVAPSLKIKRFRRTWVYSLPTPLSPASLWAQSLEQFSKKLLHWLPESTRATLYC